MVGGEGAQFYREGMSVQFAPDIVNRVWEAAKTAGFGSYFPDAIGGMVTDDHVPVNQFAGIPHGAIIADKMNLPFAYIRSKPKDHGAGNQIEGRVKSGQKMVVVEDLISTGGSVLDAVAAAKREGADVIGVVAIFTYELPIAEKNFSDAGVKLVTLSNYTELINLAEQEGYVSAEGLALLEKFKHDQENWQG